MKLIFKPKKRKNIKRPIKLRFFNTSKFPARSKAEWRLIDKNPFGDKDKDGVKNFFDCKPLNFKMQGPTHEHIGGLRVYKDENEFFEEIERKYPDKRDHIDTDSNIEGRESLKLRRSRDPDNLRSPANVEEKEFVKMWDMAVATQKVKEKHNLENEKIKNQHERDRLIKEYRKEILQSRRDRNEKEAERHRKNKESWEAMKSDERVKRGKERIKASHKENEYEDSDIED